MKKFISSRYVWETGLVRVARSRFYRKLGESRVRMVTARLCELETLGARDYHSAQSLTTTICFPGIMYSALSII